MKKLFGIISLLVILAGCSKTPNHVISEDDMASLLIDIYKAEAVIDDAQNKQFKTDSMKMKMRQSVFMRHNVTQEKYDTSMVWYAHNLDVYGEVFDEIIKRLEKEEKELNKGDFTSVVEVASGEVKPSMPRYREVGDTADIWGRNRVWTLLPGIKQHMISFDIKPDAENMRGDKYELAFKAVNMQKRLKLYMGLDYEDGSTAFQQTTFNGEGWHRCKLQSDSTRDVKRVYGYLEYESQPQKTVFIDSVEMLRTHLDKRGYTTALRQQKWIIDRALVKDEKLVFNEKKVDMVDDKLELIEAEELENPHPLQYK